MRRSVPTGPTGPFPKKSLGQHFLVDLDVVARIVAAGGLSGSETVIEVGPGTGVLTERLAEAAGRVVAVELDSGLVRRLQERFAGSEKVTIIEADVLSQPPHAFLAAVDVSASQEYGVFGNLPYNIGAAVLRHFLEAEAPPRWLVVMLQREVAAAVCAQPGDLGLLGVAVQVYAEASRLFDVPPDAFAPPPKVTSSVIRLDVRPEPLVPAPERDRFFAAVRAGFSAPRKQLRNSLAQGLQRPVEAVLPAIEGAGLTSSLRPEQLSVGDWLRLARRLGA
jgi:16S rRNA (adenine1518-N6/adenine1519-N6)-dimethyltransferase